MKISMILIIVIASLGLGVCSGMLYERSHLYKLYSTNIGYFIFKDNKIYSLEELKAYSQHTTNSLK